MRAELECDDEEDEEVQAILEAGAGIDSSEWVAREFSGVDLGDERLNRRLLKTAEFKGNSPQAPINQACQGLPGAKGAYRWYRNEKVTYEKILAPHTEATVRRALELAAEAEERLTLLAASDTVFIASDVKGGGPIGKDNEGRGLVMHNALLMTTKGVPLGLLHQNIWVRDEVPQETRQEKIERLQRTPIEEKESWKWLQASADIRRHKPPGIRVVELDDREGDFWEHLADHHANKDLYVIRARVDRRLVPEDNECNTRMHEAIDRSPSLGTMEVKVIGNGDRGKTRTATAEIRVVEVTLHPPQRRGAAKGSCPIEEITLRLVAATEISVPPAGEEAISWVLLTNLLVPNFESAKEKVTWYATRFVIETWHKTLKSGFKVEACRLGTVDRMKIHLALCSVLAVRLMNITYLARQTPEAPATQIFSAAELEALHLLTQADAPLPKEPPTMRQAVRQVARLGGHLGRKCDGEPGMTAMWRGWLQLHVALRVLRAARKLGVVNSS